MTSVVHPVVLVIRDGWGHREEKRLNMIAESGAVHTERLMASFPHTTLRCSGPAVGLPEGYQGNSEVGHMTIGSGRILYQAMERINHAIKDGSFYSNPALLDAVRSASSSGRSLHLMGLFQVEGVHAHLDHLMALLELCRREGCRDVKIHAFTDGRDSPVTDSLKHLAAVERRLAELGFGQIVSVSGRYFAMDRDKRWDRTREAYECVVNGNALAGSFSDVLAQVAACHAAGETDEFVKPRKREGYAGMRDGDSVVFFNFRTDRTRQLTMAVSDPAFDGFARNPPKVRFTAMTNYYNGMHAAVAFPDPSLANLLGEVVSRAGVAQFRVSETEKYAHVTFFFNGQQEHAFPLEDRLLIDSPKVATYDLAPEMSAPRVADALVERIESKKYGLLVVNFANGDMVGHTGVLEAIKTAVRTVDACVEKVVRASLENGYTVLVFADHGNAEDKTEAWRTSHTLNPVPLMLISPDAALQQARLRSDGGLQDIAPTVLDLMGLPVPAEITGRSLLVR